MTRPNIYTQALAAVPADVRREIDLSFAIADHIARLLHQRGMSQKELAHRMGTTESAVSRWLGGTHNFTLRTIARLSVVLGEPLIKA